MSRIPIKRLNTLTLALCLGFNLAAGVAIAEGTVAWWTVEQSPRNQGYHYNRNAETYLLVGDALGRGMVELLDESVVANLKAVLQEQRIKREETDEAHAEPQQITDTPRN